MNPICNENPEHGAMKEEPMYGLNNVIMQYGWFCQTPGCDGYGGPVIGHKPVKRIEPKISGMQLTMFVEQSSET
jgi:hypothetical protein